MPPTSREVIVWKPPHLRDDHVDTLAEAKKAEAAARLAIAQTRMQHAEMLATGVKLVLTQLQKYLRLAESEDFANAIGPLEPGIILKLAEFVSKNYRLDTGQATENIAHAIAPTMDFSKLSQEERDQWRALAVKVKGE